MPLFCSKPAPLTFPILSTFLFSRWGNAQSCSSFGRAFASHAKGSGIETLQDYRALNGLFLLTDVCDPLFVIFLVALSGALGALFFCPQARLQLLRVAPAPAPALLLSSPVHQVLPTPLFLAHRILSLSLHRLGPDDSSRGHPLFSPHAIAFWGVGQQLASVIQLQAYTGGLIRKATLGAAAAAEGTTRTMQASRPQATVT